MSKIIKVSTDLEVTVHDFPQGTIREQNRQKARIEQLKAQTDLIKAKAQTDDETEAADDGFLEALKGTAAEDWADEEN